MSESPAVDVTVRGIAMGGAGVADLPDGRVVFVPRTAPGDRARIGIEKSRPRWAVGSLRSVLEPGPDRRPALCSVYERCGGCQLQHLPYEAQIAWKGRFVADALTRIGRLGAVAPPEVVPSPRTTGYRNRITYTLRRLRGGRIVAGFHALGRPAHVLDVRGECVLPEPELHDAWLELREGWGAGAAHLPAGGRLRLTLRTGPSGVELLVEGGAADWSARALAAAVPRLVAIRHLPGEGEGTARLVHGSADAGVGTVFLQANPGAAALLRAHVLEVAGPGDSSGRQGPGVGDGDDRAGRGHGDPNPRGRAVEAYCGVGETGRALAAAGWRVVGVELDGAAVERAARRAPEGFEVRHGRVEALLSELLPVDLLLVNPPRTGLHAGVPEAVLARPPERLIYVSCDPATLARDVERLAEAYALVGLRAFDLFPQTAHVETVAVLGRRDSTS